MKLLEKQQTRQRRAIVNFVGDISKTLFETFNENVLSQINAEFDKVYSDNKNIATVLPNHTKILKLILDSSSVNHKELLNVLNSERQLAENMSIGVNATSRDSFVNSKLVISAIMIDETNEDINTAINYINDGKHGVVHPQLLTSKILKETIREFEERQRTRYHFDAEESNYQHIIDISQLSVAIIKGLFTDVVSIPIIEKEEGQIQRIISIPHPVQNVYFSIIPDHDCVIKYRDSYIPTDKETVSNYKVISKYKICSRNQTRIKLLDSETCDATLFKRYVNNKCKKSPFLLHRETFIPITNGYIVIPLKGLNLDLACENNIKQERISESLLLLGNNCKLYNNYDLLYLGNTIKYYTFEYFNVKNDIQYSASDLASLENRLIQLPKIIDSIELQQARLSLEDTEKMLNSIVQHRRIKTTTETIMEYSSYLGYASLGLVTLYLSYRFGLFELFKNCIRT